MKKHAENYIKDYWESQGMSHGESHWASWGDNWMLDLEIETIGAHISDGDDVLDVGCANGYSTFRQYENNSLNCITGIDYAKNMIEAALSQKKKRKCPDNLKFYVGNVEKLDFKDDSFDVVYTTRVLINLSTWEMQKKGIEECLRVTKPGGKIIFSEGFWEPLVTLNALRAIVQLPPLVEHDFNRYIKQNRLKEYMDNMNLNYDIEDFSSLYYLGSRFVRELVTDVDSYPGFTNPINKIFFDIEKKFSGGGVGIQKAVVITK